MALDGLTDAFDHLSMGESTERHNARLGISRAEQDEFAARSHQRAATAIKNGLLAEEIVPVPVPQRRGDPVLFDTDEGVRADTSVETLAKLRPSFAADGTITAGHGVADLGRCVRGRGDVGGRRRQAAGAPVLAEVGAHGVVAGPDNSLHSASRRTRSSGRWARPGCPSPIWT